MTLRHKYDSKPYEFDARPRLGYICRLSRAALAIKKDARRRRPSDITFLPREPNRAHAPEAQVLSSS